MEQPYRALPPSLDVILHQAAVYSSHLLSADYLHRPSPFSTLLPTHENIYTLPNILTFSRLVAAPVVGYLIIHDMHMPALGLFVYAGVTDLVDGWIARKWGLQTVVGTVIDPMADKSLMTVVTVTLAMKGALPGECFTSSNDRLPIHFPPQQQARLVRHRLMLLLQQYPSPSSSWAATSYLASPPFTIATFPSLLRALFPATGISHFPVQKCGLLRFLKSTPSYSWG